MSISDEVRACKLCPLSAKLDSGFSPQPGKGLKTAEILVVYDRLSNYDYLTQDYITGTEGIYFDSILAKAGLTRSMLYISPLLKCYGTKVPHSCYGKCKPWLQKQIDGLRPKLIITFGKESANFFYRGKLDDLYTKVATKEGISLIVLPSTFNLMNMGKHSSDYHVARLRHIVLNLGEKIL